MVISTERRKKSFDFTSEKSARVEKEKCPFCEGNEALTPPEVISYRKDATKPDTPGWWIRVVPNKYPALGREGELRRRKRGIYETMSGIGAHEVIIESPHHIEDVLSGEQRVVEEVIQVYRDRIRNLRKDTRFKYVLIFKNKGMLAGASINHSHSQLIATPVIPGRIKEELGASRRYFHLKGRCVFCDIISQEVSSKQRFLWEDENFISFCPFASCFPYEMSILPKRHYSDFKEISQTEVKSLAKMLKKCIVTLNKILPHIPYNYIIHTSPYARSNLEYYHWHLEIIPRLSRIAGFEWGTGFYINYIAPEEAAKHLKKKDEEK